MEISAKEEPYDIFICYKELDETGERTYDSVMAQDIYDKLVEKGYKVFFARITLEDKIGILYEPYIYSALVSSKVMLALGTKEEYFNAPWVRNEWSRFIEMMKTDKDKVLIPIFSKIDAYKLPEEFLMYQAQSMDKVGAMQDLIRGIDKLIKVPSKNNNEEFTYEMYEKFKKMKEKEEDEIREALAANKQVMQVYETSSNGYKISTFLISLLQAIFIFIIINSGYFIKNHYDKIAFDSINDGITYFIIFVTCILTLISYFMAIFGKKSNLITKYLYIINIFLLSTLYIKYSSQGFRVTPVFSLVILTNLILFCIMPKWVLKERELYVTKEEKEEIIKENIEVKSNFSKKLKYHRYIFIIFFMVSCLYLGCFMYNLNFQMSSQSNERDNSVLQLKIETDFINIRSEAETTSEKIGKVYKDEIYTILGSKKASKGTWYKITTNYNITGYIYSGDNFEYISIFE